MKDSFDKLKFRFDWRDYQEKFLEGFKEHITDNHLHIVAPPGSGKTILGIEMFLRIGKPTLVLAPTLTIRNQWKDRLKSFFDTQGTFGSISLDIKHPKKITISTYQSLFSLHNSYPSNKNETLLKYIERHGIATLVLDEAHHLKNGWWKSLFVLKAIKDLTVVALTATPPYDSSALELERYFRLCGPIDDEIAVPDLVRNGDLCPHQDYVHFSKPKESEIRYIVRYREQIISFFNGLLRNAEFVSFLTQNPLYKNSEDSLEMLYEYASFFSSVLIFLNASGVKIPKKKLQILGFKKGDAVFPSFTYEWAEVLLTQILIADREHYQDSEDLLAPLEKELRKIGALEKGRISFEGDNALYKNLANSPSKFKSVQQILESSHKTLGASLRAVVLTDFIRKEYLDFVGDDTSKLNKMGVLSLAHYIRVRNKLGEHLAVLTGSLLIVHSSQIKLIKAHLGLEKLHTTILKGSKDHVVVTVNTGMRNKIVATVTELFEQGTIKILIGTKSFLGEGWDAPSINTLILASYVGSFVSSNQMRGRAIRINPRSLNKVASIWHLVCLDPTVEDGGKDMQMLTQRFLAFSGISLKGTAVIENGIARLGLPKKWGPPTSISKINSAMIDFAKDKDEVAVKWEIAIAGGSILVQQLRMPFKRNGNFARLKKLRGLNVAKYLFFQILLGISLFLPEVLLKNLFTALSQGWFFIFKVVVFGLVLGFGPAMLKAIKVYFLFGNQFKRTQKIGQALLLYMKKEGMLTSYNADVQLGATQKADGSFSIYLKDANQHDGNLFVKYLAEIIEPIDNPRYLIAVNSRFKRLFGYKNYYAVPDDLGRSKKIANSFFEVWKSLIGGSKLQYTRSLEGRKLVLKARFSHVKYQFEDRPEQSISWK